MPAINPLFAFFCRALIELLVKSKLVSRKRGINVALDKAVSIGQLARAHRFIKRVENGASRTMIIFADRNEVEAHAVTDLREICWQRSHRRDVNVEGAAIVLDAPVCKGVANAFFDTLEI
ncbi:hypothetical protein A1D31_37795 [Bradyrhizobium liaoningense]|nr:hypothetical protein A1D31_37795 [Bradyrhizobium liaoningense]